MKSIFVLKAGILLACLNYQSIAQIPENDFSTGEAIILSSEPEENIPENSEDIVPEKVNLNNASREQLLKFPFLSVSQVNELWTYRFKYGPFLTIYELECLETFNYETIALLLPHIIIGSKEDFYVHKKGRNDLIFRTGIKLKDGEVGSLHPINGYFRYNYHKNDVSMGFLMDKDPGEKAFAPLPEFVSGFFEYSGRKNQLHIIGGNFRARFGQGLTMWSGGAFGKTFSPHLLIRKNFGLTPYNSSTESGFLTGIGVAGKLGGGKMSGFYSSTGYGQVKRVVAGTNFSREISRKLKINLTAEASKAPSELSSTVMNLGVSYIYAAGNLLTAGEISLAGKAPIIVNSVFLHPAPDFTMCLVYRNYPRHNPNYFSNGFSAGNKTYNEKGLLMVAEFSVPGNLKINFLFDNYTFPYPRYRVDFPSTGYDVKINLQKEKRYSYRVYCGAGSSYRERNSPSGGIAKVRTNKYYLVYSFFPDELFNPLTKISFNTSEGYKGLMLFQDLKLKFNTDSKVYFRYGIFDVENFAARVYTYENDALYSFSIPFYSGAGTRYYFLLNKRFGDNLQAWVKLGQTRYFKNRVVNDSKHDEWDCRFQIRVRW